MQRIEVKNTRYVINTPVAYVYRIERSNNWVIDIHTITGHSRGRYTGNIGAESGIGYVYFLAKSNK